MGLRDFRLRYEDGTVRATWAAASVPDGYSVEVVFTNADGTDLSPQPTMTYTTGAAEVTSPVTLGTTFRARARVVSAAVHATVSTHRIGSVRDLAVEWRAGGLHASWTAPADGDPPATHEVRLLDAARVPVSPQPVFTTGRFDGSALRDQAEYVVAVRGERDGSVGPWAHSASYKVDKSLPDSDLLRALLRRLRDAIPTGTGQLVLSPAVVSAPHITSLHGSLLGFAQDTVTVTAVAVSSTPDRVTVTGTVALSLAQRKTVSAEWVFRADAARVDSTMTVSDLGEYTPDELVRRGVVPTSDPGVTVWGTGLPTLPRLSLTVDSRTGEARFAGDPSATPWQVPVGLADVSFGTATPVMRITASGHVPEVATGLRLGTTPAIPVRLSIPAGPSGWAAELAGGPHDVGAATAFEPLLAGTGWHLPQGVLDLNGFTVRSLVLEFPTDRKPAVWRLATELDVAAATGSWRALDGVVTLERIHVTLYKLMVREDDVIVGTTSGSIAARLVLVDALRVDVALDVPASDGTWELYGSARVSGFAFTELARFFGGDAAPLTDLLAKVGTLGTAELIGIGLRFTPTGASSGLHSLAVRAGLSRWTVAALPWFSVDAVRIGIEVDEPFTAARTISGDLAGTWTLGTARFWLLAQFDKDGWSGSAVASGPRIDKLDQLTVIVPKETVTGFLAEATVTTEFGLAGVTLAYDFGAGHLSRVGFLLHSKTVWHWLGDSLSLRGITVDLTAHRVAEAWSVSGRIAGRITLAGAEITMEATKAASDSWAFHGALDDALTVDFAGVLSTAAKSLRLPSGHGLPAELVVEELTVDVVPATGKADFVGASRLEWSTGLGAGTVSMAGLGAELHLPAPAGALTGRFSLGTVTGAGRIAFGTGDTVIAVRVTDSTVVAVVDRVVGTGTYDATPAPAAFQRPTRLVDVTLDVNLTRNRLLLVGRHTADTRYTAVALLVAQAATKWEFALALALRRFDAAEVSPALSGVDSDLGLAGDHAAIVLSTFTGASDADLHTHVPALPTNTELRRGLTFCVRLDLTRGLAGTLASVVNLTGDYVVSGHLPADIHEPVRLSAALPKLRLFDTFDFDSVVLTYLRTPAKDKVPATSALAIGGNVAARLDGVTHTFRGDLVVSAKHATFRAQLDERVTNPLGVPGLALDKLGIDLARDLELGRTDTELFGEVAFTAGPTLRGDVMLVDGEAVLLVVRLLDRDLKPARLSISNLLTQTTGLTWPQVLDVVLENGWLSYVPGQAPVTHDGTTYQPGLCAAADVTVSVLPKARLDVTVYGTDTATRKKGLTASAQILAPVDWSFVKFAGTAAHGGTAAGPWLSIDTTRTKTPFTVATNLTLLGVELADVELSVGRDTMRGTVTLPAQAGPFAGSTLEFTWDEHGLRVANWPLPDLSLPEFSFEDLKGSGTCATKRVLLSLPVRSRFNLDASLAVEPGTPATLVVTLAGTFTLETTSWAHRDDPIVTATIAGVRLRVPFPGPKGYDWAALADGFVTAIKEAAGSIFENLLADPKTLAKLAAVAGARWAVGEAVGYLQCRGMKPVEAQTTVDGAMSAAVVTVPAVCAAGTVAVGGVVGSLVGGVFTLGGVRLPGHMAPRTPARPAMSFDTTTLTVSWTATDATGYGVELTDDAGGYVPVPLTTGMTVAIDLAAIRAHSGLGRTVTARVHPVGLGGRGTPSEPATLFLLAEPAAPRLVFHDDETRTLTVAWSVLSKATEHDVQVLDSAGSPLLTHRVLAVGQTELDSTPLSGKTGLRIRLRGRAQGVVGAWGPAADLTHPVLPAPTGLRVAHGVDRVEASWQAGDPGVGYAAQLVTGGAPAPTQPAFTVSDAAATFPADGLRPGDALRVRATTTLGAGLWGPPVRLPFSPVPEGYQPVLAEDLDAFTAAFFGMPAGSIPLIERGRHEWLNSTMVSVPMQSGHGLIQFGVLSGADTPRPPRTVVLGSPAPLTSFWSAPGLVVSHWTSTGWRSGQEPVPVRGLYFHRLDFPAARGRRIELGAGRPGPIAAMVPGAGGAMPAGFVPVLAATAGELVRQVLDLPSTPDATLSHGSLTPGGAVGGDSSSVVELILDKPAVVTTGVVACTTAELTRWRWGTSDGHPTGTCSVWTVSGWRPMTGEGLPSAEQVAGRFFYRVELAGASVGGVTYPFCSIGADASFTAAFFVAPVAR